MRVVRGKCTSAGDTPAVWMWRHRGPCQWANAELDRARDGDLDRSQVRSPPPVTSPIRIALRSYPEITAFGLNPPGIVLPSEASIDGVLR